MKTRIVSFWITALAIAGCAEDPPMMAAMPPAPATQPAAAADPVLATIGADSITSSQVESLLVQSYGLEAMLSIAQLDLVKRDAAAKHIIITPDDIANERKITLEQLKHSATLMDAQGHPASQPSEDWTPQQLEQMLQQVLLQQKLSMAQFNLTMETNAYLRKILKQEVTAKITEDDVHKTFDANYGAKVKVEYIVCNSVNDATAVKNDLAAGKTFEQAAIAHGAAGTTINPADLPVFTLKDPSVPSAIRTLAFSLKIGDVSTDLVQLKDKYYIIKVVDHIPPTVAKYEDYRDSVRQDLIDQVVQADMENARGHLVVLMRSSLNVTDPELLKQWQDLTKASGSTQDPHVISQEMDQSRAAASRQSNAAPSTQPVIISPTTIPTVTPAAAPPAAAR